jgi:hypothetical protein
MGYILYMYVLTIFVAYIFSIIINKYVNKNYINIQCDNIPYCILKILTLGFKDETGINDLINY